jgi:hypothetical protein
MCVVVHILYWFSLHACCVFNTKCVHAFSLRCLFIDVSLSADVLPVSGQSSTNQESASTDHLAVICREDAITEEQTTSVGSLEFNGNVKNSLLEIHPDLSVNERQTANCSSDFENRHSNKEKTNKARETSFYRLLCRI